MTRAWTWRLPGGNGPRRCSIDNITIRRTTGADEAVAIQYAEAKGRDGNVGDELIRASIVKVDGEPVEQPFTDIDAWNKRTRNFVAMAFNVVNGTVPDERDRYLASAVAVLRGGWCFTVPKPKKNDEHADKRVCEISTIVAREVTGSEETEATRRAKQDAANENTARVLAGVVSVDDETLTAERFEALSSRARRFIIEAYDCINGTAGAEDFLSSASEDEMEPMSPGADIDETSSETG